MGTAILPCRILLAEDNPADVRLVQEALRVHQVHCELRVISDGEEVIAFISGLDRDPEIPCPNLLLLDLHLPKRGGEEVMKCLRASKRCGQTRIVIMSSSDAPADLRIAETNVAVQYFRKPSSLPQFLRLGSIIKDALGGAQSE